MDWDPADVVAALRKAGWSLRRLSRAHGYHPDALKHALRRPYPQAERIIARALGTDPESIWPSRYRIPEPGRAPSPGCPHEDSGKNNTPGA